MAFAKATAPSSVVMEAEYKTYENDAGVIVFTQRFPNGLSEQDTTRRNGLSARTVFPSFQRSKLDCFAYHGVFPAMKGCTLSTYKETHAGGAPLTIYDGANGSLPMTVFSPLSSPLAHHMASTDDFIGAGVKASVTTVPKGWEQSLFYRLVPASKE